MFRGLSGFTSLIAVVALGLAVSLVAVDTADARRAGGGFGSRGSRTFETPATTRITPSDASPINRTMTPRTQADQQNAAQPQRTVGQQQRPGMFGGIGRSLVGGLLLGGLFGMLLGQGFGGAMGLAAMVLQILLIGGAILLAMRFFANRRQNRPPATALSLQTAGGPTSGRTAAFNMSSIGSGFGGNRTPAQSLSDDIHLSQRDLDRFEALLTEIQTAYGDENYPALRRVTTPEAMSFLAEELADNASKGVRNVVSRVKLLQGRIAEAWREGAQEYATLAMRYSSIDAMVDRASGTVIAGDTNSPSETTEIWTFVRRPGVDWQLSAIQAA